MGGSLFPSGVPGQGSVDDLHVFDDNQHMVLPIAEDRSQRAALAVVAMAFNRDTLDLISLECVLASVAAVAFGLTHSSALPFGQFILAGGWPLLRDLKLLSPSLYGWQRQ